jgi:hypothetical protein
MRQYPLGKQLFWLNGMKLSTTLHHSVAQIIPKLRRKKKWRRRSREWISLWRS